MNFSQQTSVYSEIFKLCSFEIKTQDHEETENKETTLVKGC